MKILIFAEVYYPDVMGGGEFSTKQMAEGLHDRGHDVVVYCLGKETCEEEINGVFVKRQYIEGTSGHYLSLCKNNRLTDPFTGLSKILRKRGDLYRSGKWYERYRTIIMKEAPDAVHTASPMSYLGRMNLWKAAHDLEIPVSHVCRGPALTELNFAGGLLDGFNRRRNAKASSYLTALAAPSRYMLDVHHRAGIRGQRFNEVIYNSAGLSPVPVTDELMGRKENMILYAGELSEKKGLGTLMEAAGDLPDVKVVLIGRGDMEDALKSDGRAEVLDWMDRKTLFGFMQTAKAVVLPSIWEEPFGRILPEAIFNGTIAIGSDRGGIPEVLDHDEKYIFKSKDAEGLRRRIDRVMKLSAPEYMQEIRHQQQTTAALSDDTYTDRWESFFSQQSG